MQKHITISMAKLVSLNVRNKCRSNLQPNPHIAITNGVVHHLTGSRVQPHRLGIPARKLAYLLVG
jgi:hypothetical protein